MAPAGGGSDLQGFCASRRGGEALRVRGSTVVNEPSYAPRTPTRKAVRIEQDVPLEGEVNIQNTTIAVEWHKLAGGRSRE